MKSPADKRVLALLEDFSRQLNNARQYKTEIAAETLIASYCDFVAAMLNALGDDTSEERVKFILNRINGRSPFLHVRAPTKADFEAAKRRFQAPPQ